MPFSFYTITKQTPFLRPLILLMAGIATEWYCNVDITFAICLFSVSLIVFLLFFIHNISAVYSLRWMAGLAVYLLFFSAGMVATYEQNVTHENNYFGKPANEDASFYVTIQEPLLNKAKTSKATASVDYVLQNGKWQKASGNIFIYFNKDESLKEIHYGSQLILHKKLLPIQGSGNPGAFNYTRFCLFEESVTHQAFISQNDYMLLQTNVGNSFQRFIFNTRDHMLQVLRQNIQDSGALSVAEALLIGYRNDLDKDLYQAYSNTGVVHIIAISGLHLAFIYGLLIWLFNFLPNKKYIRQLRFITVLLVLWIFTLMAGAGPSIMRAAIMFTCLSIGNGLEKQTNMINNLAASAFMLLLINPFNLWDVGFQLSYTAVLSIVLFYNPLHKLIYVKNKLLSKLWSLSAVTLSAQLLTLPVVIFHFHQLPSLFLITNLVAVPAATIVLGAELALLCCSWFSWLANIIGAVTGFIIHWLNEFILYVDRIPFSVWNGIKSDALTLICMYGCLLCIIFWLKKKVPAYLIKAICLVIIMLADRDIDLYKTSQQQTMIVYNISKQPAIDFISNHQCEFACNDVVLNDHSIYNFNIKPSHQLYRVNEDEMKQLPDITNHILRFNNHTILVLDHNISNYSNTPIPVDVIIIVNNAFINLNNLSQAFRCSQIVAASGNSFSKIERWKKECEQLHLRFHAVPQQGAFVMDF